jgi:hypothetical protein
MKCMVKYLKAESHHWIKITLYCMLATILILGFFVLCMGIGYVGNRFGPAFWGVVASIDVPAVIYGAIMIITFWVFTVRIAMGNRESLMMNIYEGHNVVSKEQITTPWYCFIAIGVGGIVTEAVMLAALVYGVHVEFLPTLGLYSLGIFICTPVCCAYAWCKQDPESPTDSIQQPPKPETETSQDLQENPAETNPTHPEIDSGNDGDV